MQYELNIYCVKCKKKQTVNLNAPHEHDDAVYWKETIIQCQKCGKTEFILKKPINSVDLNLVCQKAIEIWGKRLQQIVCIEELSELIQVLTKVIRFVETTNHENFSFEKLQEYFDYTKIIEEITDVEIMIYQMKFVFNIFEDVNAFKMKRWRRTSNRIEKELKKRGLTWK